ncbi:MAG: hypothetical protein KF854_00775 [Nitrospira sp.]|nr:hypothetical protein [Nitrospira sp.]MBX3513131.1 hypothetical protein [Xanthobacteraceae bacterium]
MNREIQQSPHDLARIYNEQFLPARNAEWFSSYCKAVKLAQEASESTFRSSEFQQGLWEVDGVSGIGPGSSVVVTGAYQDQEIIEALLALRDWKAPADARARAQYLDAEFQRIISLVTPRHNSRRPRARLVRIFAVLRPYDVCCLLDSYRTSQVRQWLGLSRMGLGLIGQNVIACAAIAGSLGPKTSIEDAVSYNMFSWFIWQLISAEENESLSASTEARDLSELATDAPSLVLLRPAMQRKGMFFVAGNLDLLLSMVSAAENGLEREELLRQIGEEAPNLNRGSQQNVLAQAVSLNILTIDGAVYRPTDIGRSLLEGENPADVLVPIFVRTILGFGLVLKELRERPRRRGEIANIAREYYPQWTSDFAPNALVSWLQALELVSVQGNGRSATVQLTEAGEYWASGVPAHIPRPPAQPAALPVEEEIEPTSSRAAVNGLKPVSADEILSRFKSDTTLASLIFDDAQIRLLHAALHGVGHKRFILLSGLSGTGKTSIARAYAKAYCDAKGLSHAEHYEQVSVWPDWSDPSGLLGFVNPLSSPPTFQQTSTLKLLIEADRNRDKPYFLCLDEMNLARVEHYFAPFLSAMEGANGKLSIHAGNEDIDNVPHSIAWPSNLFVMGTVNMDETTFSFSDKVLDRAFTFEFWNIDFDAWRERVAAKYSSVTVQEVSNVLEQLYKALSPARRHFGYRTCDEVLGFCSIESGLNIKDSLDAAVLAKVLPKLRGDSSGQLPTALQEVIRVCEAEGLTQSAAKVKQMQASLNSLGIVKFWS